MSSIIPPLVTKYGGLVLIAVGLFIAAHSLLSGDTLANRNYKRYVAHLNRTLKLLFLEGSGERIAATQGALVPAVIIGGIWVGAPYYWYFALVAVLVGPAGYLWYKRRQHILQLEEQVDGLVLALANALKTVPSPSAAMGTLTLVLPVPMQLEIERLLKEMRVGSTLEQALLNMTARLRSPELDVALSSLLIGLQVGGNLPQTLETTAATIREMHRLQGVVKTKTAEGRAQLWVLAIFPFAIAYMFTVVDPEYFVPLQNSFVGNLITALALSLWIGALYMARKILQVDI